jgi:hypothetical protein
MKDRRKKSGLIALAAFLASTVASWAGDWTIVAVNTNELNIAENRALRSKSLGTSIGLISTSSLNFAYAMPDGKFSAVADISSERYFGEASEDGSNGYYPHLGAEWTKSGRTDTISLMADYRTSNVTLQKALDDSLPFPPGFTIPVGAIQDTYMAGLTWSRQLDRRNSLSWNTKYTQVAYTDDDVVVAGVRENAGIDNTVLSNSLTWSRKANRRTDLNFSAGLDWLSLDDLSGTDRLIYSLDAEVSRKLSSRLTAIVGGGIQMVQTIVPAETTYSNDYKFNAALEYAMKRGALSWQADYGITQGALGDLVKKASTSLGMKHQINDRSSIGAQASLTLGEGDSGDLGSSLVFQFSPTYNLALTDEWDFAAGYRFVYQDEEDDVMSNTVFMSLTREFHIVR